MAGRDQDKNQIHHLPITYPIAQRLIHKYAHLCGLDIVVRPQQQTSDPGKYWSFVFAAKKILLLRLHNDFERRLHHDKWVYFLATQAEVDSASGVFGGHSWRTV